MSTGISWSPIHSQSLCAGCGSVARKLAEVFGQFPITLTLRDMEKLLVMAKMHGSNDNPYQRLADAISEHEEILVDIDV